MFAVASKMLYPKRKKKSIVKVGLISRGGILAPRSKTMRRKDRLANNSDENASSHSSNAPKDNFNFTDIYGQRMQPSPDSPVDKGMFDIDDSLHYSVIEEATRSEALSFPNRSNSPPNRNSSPPRLCLASQDSLIGSNDTQRSTIVPIPSESNRKSYLPFEKAHFTEEFRPKKSWFIQKVFHHLLSIDILFCKLLILMGAAVFDNFEGESFSYFAAFADCTEDEWKIYYEEWGALGLQLPSCGWVYDDYDKLRLYFNSDFFGKALSSPLIAISNYLTFTKIGFGFWSEKSLQVLIESKIVKFKLEPLIEAGHAGDILSAGESSKLVCHLICCLYAKIFTYYSI